MDQHSIAAAGIAARISADGAELQSLRNAADHEFLWGAGPAWPRHAPNLFPIVGRLANDTLRHRGHPYKMTQHGFARDRRFSWLDRSDDTCRLVLTDDEQTREKYPFPFRLEIAYAAEPDSLTATFTIMNTGTDILPASMGAHPAFRWPLAAGIAKNRHTLTFSQVETGPIRRLSGGLLRPDALTSPVSGRTLSLDEGLFLDDAIIFDQLESRSVRFAATGAPGVEVAWEGFSELGIWMKPGSDFLCIEPWQGYASSIGFDGEFSEKPGVLLIPPGEMRSASYRIRLFA
jgi:galactose mutarotase-like enzyme